MNSEWQLNKIGLLDFWYYDQQEFEFLDGRMLLRGANGSGKSVTMQSFIPLLLDGNMRPERLDPFGSRARKMENYLLEEGDDREERTGYLYMELKRVDSEVYTSIGIGIRARKNKKLDTWYFCITDGRRIGIDIFLYKDVQSRLTCTRQELKNRIGEGGRVMETQAEYAQYVNRLLFGFETMEEYGELIELLIQLRTPKLSKDFKPSIINEILSKSLQTLSEDDLRPMSEAIENMDALKTNLDALNDSVKAAEQIEKSYHQYNEIVLRDKAGLFHDAVKACREAEQRAEKLVLKMEDSRQAHQQSTAQREKLEQEEQVVKQEYESLQGSDAARLKQQELLVQKQMQETTADLSKKEIQEQAKEDQQRTAEQKRKKLEEENQLKWDEIDSTLDEMEQAIEDISFDEFAFLKKELQDQPTEEYQFAAHNRLLAEYTKKVQDGREILQEESNSRKQRDDKLKELDEKREEQEQKEKECRQCETLFSETKAELTEHFYMWEQHNSILHLPDDIRQKTALWLEQYEYGMDYSEVRNLGKDVYFDKERELEHSLRVIQEEQERKQKEYDELSGELEEWRSQKDPEPEQSEAVLNNRRLLLEKNIPYLRFYQAIDFGDGLTEEQTGHLEEALLSMGILDALIVSSDYREQIHQLDPGACDKYIFSDVKNVKQNLQQLLEVDNGDNDILKYQTVANILSSIGVTTTSRDGNATWVDTDGNFGIGVLEGTVTRQYKARYIGVKAREKFRTQKIQELEQTLALLEEVLEEEKKKIQELVNNKMLLTKEWEAYPSGDDLKTAAKQFADASYELEQLGKSIALLRQQLQKMEEQLNEIQIKVRDICGKCYLTARLDVFTEALDSLETYRELLTKVRVFHEQYRNGIQRIGSLEEQLAVVEADLEEIRYEKSACRRKKNQLEATLQSIREQLSLTDYESIKERLDYCTQRLADIPTELVQAAQDQQRWKDSIENLKEEIQQQELDYQRNRVRKQALERAFAEEYQLGYVERSFVVTEDMEDQAQKVCAMLAGRFGGKKPADLQNNLQAAYHENRGYLLDYQLTMQTLFTEENPELAESKQRIDIVAKYRGVTVGFRQLLDKLREDAKEQQRLLSDKDRELFEDILANTVSKKIRAKIHASMRWVETMNQLMESMKTSSGLKLSLNWKKKRAEKEEQLDTRELVELLSKDVEVMREEEVEKLSVHFRSKIAEARKLSEDGNSVQSFHAIMREVLDYRKWFEFTLECQKTGEKKKELTDRVFFTFSGGEKAMAMYVPLFSAVVAKYAGARADAPRLISLDEAFAGVDETNIRDMFRLMVECKFNFMINSQVLWGDYDTIPGLAIYQLLRPENAKFVTVITYIWNGHEKLVAGR